MYRPNKTAVLDIERLQSDVNKTNSVEAILYNILYFILCLVIE